LYSMDEHVASMSRHYNELLATRPAERLVTPPAPATEIEDVRYV
jgi:hypothetical protein